MRFDRRLHGLSLIAASVVAAAALYLAMPSGSASAQASFSSGSNGSDGALNLTKSGNFDPSALGLDADHDNVYHFTTITIAPGVVVNLTSKIINGPVYWLASGDVLVSGTLVLDGEPGHSAGTNTSIRFPAAGGAGGYFGGVGGHTSGSFPPAQNGGGPGGGPAGSPGASGVYTGNQYLRPLVGGSGAGGSNETGTRFGWGGGGGGGAILIASSTTIRFEGRGATGDPVIRARSAPRASIDLPCGSGGAIHLVANRIEYAPVFQVSLDASSDCGNGGTVRAEYYSIDQPNRVTVSAQHFLISTPLGVLLPSTPPPALKVTKVAGLPVTVNPFAFPDAIINSTGDVVVEVQGQYIPIGTKPTLLVYGETGPDRTVECTPLAAPLASSTASCTVTFSVGGSRGFVKAAW